MGDPAKGSEDLGRLQRAMGGVALRLSLYRGARLACRRVLACSIPALGLLVAARFVPLPLAPEAAGLLLFCGALWGAAEGVRRRATLLEAARLADRRLGLSELLPTALESGASAGVARALARRAADAVGPLRPSRVASFPLPWEAAGLLLLAGGAFALSALTSPRSAGTPGPAAAAAGAAHAREIRWLAGQIDHRFPEAAEVTRELRRFADGLAAAGDSFTRTGRAMAEKAGRWEGEAEKLALSEERLRSLLASAPSSAAPPGPPDAAGIEKARAALTDLMAAPGLSPRGEAAVRGALRALEGGDRPRFAENAEVLREELKRVRAAMTVLEAASLRLKAVSERTLAESDRAPEAVRAPDRGDSSDEAGGPPAASSVSPPGIPGRRAGQALGSPRWDPSYDEVVRRYFRSFEGVKEGEGEGE